MRTSRKRAGAFVSLAATFAYACSDGQPAVHLEQRAQAIIGGQADRSRSAVVALLPSTTPAEYVPCSGTIVDKQVADQAAFVLTAAHCVQYAHVARVADDVAEGTRLDLFVDAVALAPSEDAAVADVAVVTVRGDVASLPTIPVLAPGDDEVAAGSAIVAVGYGRTKPGAPELGAGANTSRRAITRVVTSSSSERFTTGYAGGGACWGDDGGPALFVHDAREHVAGVFSSFAGNCMVSATATRTSPLAAFVKDAIAKERARLAAAPRDAGREDAGAAEDAIVPPAAHAPEKRFVDASTPWAAPSGASSSPAHANEAPVATQGCAIAARDTTSGWLLGLALVLCRRRRL